MRQRVIIEASFAPVSATNFQRVADKIKAVIDTEGTGAEVVVRAVITRPTEVEFRPDGRAARCYWPGLRNVEVE